MQIGRQPWIESKYTPLARTPVRLCGMPDAVSPMGQPDTYSGARADSYSTRERIVLVTQTTVSYTHLTLPTNREV